MKNLLFLFYGNFPLTNSEAQYYKIYKYFYISIKINKYFYILIKILIYKNLTTAKLSSEAINSTNINLAYIAHIGDIVGSVPVLNIFAEIFTTKCMS